MPAYVAETGDLSSFGGPQDGYLVNGIVQEVDIATGMILRCTA